MTAKVPLKVHLRLRFQNPGKPRTAGLCGRVAGACDCGPLSCTKSNGPHCSKNLPVKFDFSPIDTSATIAKELPPQRCSQPLFIAFFNFSHKRPTLAFSGENGYTLSSAQGIAHSGSHGETRAFRLGVLSLPSERFARFGNPAWSGVRTANFAALGSWSEALLKDTESLRNSDALMRVAVPRRRGPAGLRDPVSMLLIMW